MFKRAPEPGAANAAFGNEAVDVGIPFEVTAKGMQDTDKAGSKTLGFIGGVEHSEDNTADGRKKAVQKLPILQKERTELFSDGEDAVPVGDINELEGHGGSSVNGIFNAAGGTEAAMAAEGYKFKRTTGRASVHGAAKGGIPAMDHFFNILNNGLAWMKKIDHFFVMVSKNVLKYIHKIIMRENGTKRNPYPLMNEGQGS